MSSYSLINYGYILFTCMQFKNVIENNSGNNMRFSVDESSVRKLFNFLASCIWSNLLNVFNRSV